MMFNIFYMVFNVLYKKTAQEIDNHFKYNISPPFYHKTNKNKMESSSHIITPTQQGGLVWLVVKPEQFLHLLGTQAI